ncbi:chorion protein S19 [Lucilia cuprina]|uniref:chorion protein S19 n=1 Tax=Lucilia cuprina TaxID=7375 RepID=UPI001F0569EB|nr:chorion protein S19 [Lucilia cuprina]
MNKYISFAFVVCALVASAHCNSYGSYGGSAPASAYNANSYALGPGPVVYASPPAAYQAAPASYPAPPSYSAPSYPAAKPKYTIQPAYSHELYPGQNNYRSYHSAPVYSQVALPIVPSSPVAKLYVPAQQSYASAPSYGGSGY